MQINHSLLWRSFIDGNRQALEAIYNLYYEMLYEYGFRRSASDDWTRDCIQEIFVRLWIGRSGINPNANVRFYLLKALKNQLLDHRQAQNKHVSIAIQNDQNFTMQFSVEEDPLRKAQLTHQSSQLLQALNQLSDRQKEVIYLKYFAELDNAEIAELLDINVRAVYKLTARALEALRAILHLSKEDLLLLLLSLSLAPHN